VPGSSRNRVWASSTRKPSPPKPPEALKQRVQEQGDRLVDEVLKQRFVREGPEHPGYNYVVNVFTRWFRSWFYLCAEWRSPSPDALSEGFETRFARLEYAGGDRFDLAFMRYTGEWITVYDSMTAEEALAAVRDDPFFSIP
jgi:hypothetical protein